MTISPEQIAANIAASRARKAAQQAAQKASRVSPPHRFAGMDSKLIGFVVKTRHGKFKPFVGKVTAIYDHQDDALVHVVGEQPPQDTLSEALAFYESDKDAYAMVLAHPVPSGGMMGHWLRHMLSFQEEVVNRCPTCGHRVQSVFDHVAIDCEHDMTEQEIARLIKESDNEPSSVESGP